MGRMRVEPPRAMGVDDLAWPLHLVRYTQVGRSDL